MTGTFAFDPHAFVKPEPEPSRRDTIPASVLPAEWEHGLVLLRDRRVPRLATPTRWEQIIRDAELLTTVWCEHLLATGWSMENVFGFVPDGGTADFGLAVALRGRRPAAIGRQWAAIPTETGHRWHYPRLPVGTPLLWSFDERKL